MAGKLTGTKCALRPCVSCGERTWVLASDGTCPDCGGRSLPTITQAEVQADTENATRMFGAISAMTVDSPERCAAFVSAFADAKKRWARYTAFQKYGVNRLEYEEVRTAYGNLVGLVKSKLDEWYGTDSNEGRG